MNYYDGFIYNLMKECKAYSKSGIDKMMFYFDYFRKTRGKRSGSSSASSSISISNWGQ